MRLALIATSFESSSFHPAESSLAIASFQYHFAGAGFDEIAYFPENTDVTVANIHTRFRAFAEETDCEIYAFSCWSNSFAFVKDLVAIIREVRPNAIVVGGGVHFLSKEDVRKNLKNGLFEIIFSGGGDPFIDFCLSYFIKKTLTLKRNKNFLEILGDVPKRGINYIAQSGLIETPYGRMTKPILPVIFMSDEKFEVQVFFSDVCDNACDYCSVYKSGTDADTRNKIEQLLLAQLDFVREQYNGTITVSVMDSSPLQHSNRKNTIKSLRRAKQRVPNVCFTIFADPEDLDAELSQYIEELDIKTIFLGRDRVTEDEFIGRRLHGKLRDTTQLDMEFIMLCKFMEMMNKSNSKRELFVGYIVSPEETQESALKMLEEAKLYAETASDKLFVQSNVFILNPYKSTKLGKKIASTPRDIADMYFPYPNVWHAEGKVQEYLEYVRLLVAPVLSMGTFPKLGYNLFRLVYDKCFAVGTPEPLQLCGDEKILYSAIYERLEKLNPLTDGVKLYTLGIAPSVSKNVAETLSDAVFEKILRYIEKNDPLLPYLKKDLAQE